MRYTTVIEYVKRYIAEHQLRSGDKLPTEKELADTLNVSRITVRRAYQELMYAGIIQRVQGSGTFYTGNEKDVSHEAAYHIPLVLVGSQGYASIETIRGADQYLGRHNCYLSVRCSQSDPEQERQCISQLVDSGASCILIFPCSSNENADFYYNLIQQGIHFIFLDRLPRQISASLVTCDNFSGGYLAAKHLLEAGCRRPCFISIDPVERASTLSRRKDGFRFMLDEAGIDYCDETFCFTQAENIPAELSRRMAVPEPPDGLFCVNDLTAQEVVRYLDSAHIHYPEQLALISFDDTPFASTHTIPITEISQSFFQQGYEAARLAYHILSGKNAIITQKNLPVSLIVRKSTQTAQWLQKHPNEKL